MLRELAVGAAGGPKDLQLIRMKFSTSTTPLAVHLRRIAAGALSPLLYMQPPAPGSTVEIFDGCGRRQVDIDYHRRYIN